MKTALQAASALTARTVMVDGLAVSSCLYWAALADGVNVDTIEGRGSGDELDPVQRSFIECGAFQCGYCTPGMILAAKSLLDERPRPTEAEVRHWMEGNICRCTGYQTIVDAVLDAAGRGAP